MICKSCDGENNNESDYFFEGTFKFVHDEDDKFISKKADEAREVPLGDRNAKNWLAISADLVKNVLFKSAVMR